MKLNFEDEAETSESGGHIKIPQTDIFYKEQVKIDELNKLKDSIKFLKILILILVLFSIVFIIFQIFQDFQFSFFQQQLKILKNEIEELKSNNNNNIDTNNKNKITEPNKKINEEKIQNETNEASSNKKKMVDFSAETIVLKEKFNKEILFLQECMSETKIKNFEKKVNPKISVVVPTYQTERYINRLMQSIQKQKIEEIEIIFVEDLSSKNEFPKLEGIQQKDKRIVIVKNEKDKSLLNSYILGISSVNSKYMIFLEEEGMLLPYLKEMYDLVATYNRDISDFSSLKGNINGITFNEKINEVERVQPELSESYYNENFINSNPLLSKIYKTEAIKEAIKNINEFYITEKFDLHVDSLLYICFCSYVNSYKAFGNMYSEYHLKNEFKRNIINVENMFNSTLYLAQFIYELKYEYEEIFNQRCGLIINLFNWPLNYNLKMHIDIDKVKIFLNTLLHDSDLNQENQRKINLVLRKVNDRAIKIVNDEF